MKITDRFKLLQHEFKKKSNLKIISLKEICQSGSLPLLGFNVTRSLKDSPKTTKSGPLL